MDDQSDESVLFIYRKTESYNPFQSGGALQSQTRNCRSMKKIRDKEVRVIGAEGEQLGIMSSAMPKHGAGKRTWIS